MVTTYDSFNFKYGIAQVTARLPFGQGLWPAIWFIPADGSWPPRSTSSSTGTPGPPPAPPSTTASRTSSSAAPSPSPRPTRAGTPTPSTGPRPRITVYYDDTLALTTTTDIPQQPMYLLLDLANENNSPGSCDGTMYVKSVNIWDQP